MPNDNDRTSRSALKRSRIESDERANKRIVLEFSDDSSDDMFFDACDTFESDVTPVYAYPRVTESEDRVLNREESLLKVKYEEQHIQIVEQSDKKFVEPMTPVQQPVQAIRQPIKLVEQPLEPVQLPMIPVEPVQTPVEQPEQTPVEQPEQTPMEQPVQTPVEQPEQTPVEQPEQTPVEQPEQTPVEQPVQKTVAKTTNALRGKGGRNKRKSSLRRSPKSLNNTDTGRSPSFGPTAQKVPEPQPVPVQKKPEPQPLPVQEAPEPETEPEPEPMATAVNKVTFFSLSATSTNEQSSGASPTTQFLTRLSYTFPLIQRGETPDTDSTEMSDNVDTDMTSAEESSIAEQSESFAESSIPGRSDSVAEGSIAEQSDNVAESFIAERSESVAGSSNVGRSGSVAESFIAERPDNVAESSIAERSDSVFKSYERPGVAKASRWKRIKPTIAARDRVGTRRVTRKMKKLGMDPVREPMNSFMARELKLLEIDMNFPNRVERTSKMTFEGGNPLVIEEGIGEKELFIERDIEKPINEEETAEEASPKAEEPVKEASTTVEETVEEASTTVEETVEEASTKVKGPVIDASAKLEESVEEASTKVEGLVKEASNKIEKTDSGTSSGRQTSAEETAEHSAPKVRVMPHREKKEGIISASGGYRSSNFHAKDRSAYTASSVKELKEMTRSSRELADTLKISQVSTERPVKDAVKVPGSPSTSTLSRRPTASNSAPKSSKNTNLFLRLMKNKADCQASSMHITPIMKTNLALRSSKDASHRLKVSEIPTPKPGKDIPTVLKKKNAIPVLEISKDISPPPRVSESITLEPVTITIEDHTIDTVEDHTMNTIEDHTMDIIEDHTMNTIEDHTMDIIEDQIMDTTQEPSMNTVEDHTKDITQKHSMSTVEDHTMDTNQEHSVSTVEDHTIDTIQEPSMHTGEDHTMDTTHEPSMHTGEDHTKDTTQKPSMSTVEDHTMDTTQKPSMNTAEDHTMNTTQEPSVSTVEDHTMDPIQEPSVSTVEDHTMDTTQKPSLNTVEDHTMEPIISKTQETHEFTFTALEASESTTQESNATEEPMESTTSVPKVTEDPILKIEGRLTSITETTESPTQVEKKTEKLDELEVLIKERCGCRDPRGSVTSDRDECSSQDSSRNMLPGIRDMLEIFASPIVSHDESRNSSPLSSLARLTNDLTEHTLSSISILEPAPVKEPECFTRSTFANKDKNSVLSTTGLEPAAFTFEENEQNTTEVSGSGSTEVEMKGNLRVFNENEPMTNGQMWQNLQAAIKFLDESVKFSDHATFIRSHTNTHYYAKCQCVLFYLELLSQGYDKATAAKKASKMILRDESRAPEVHYWGDVMLRRGFIPPSYLYTE